MLTLVNPQLSKIDALTEPGCYCLTFAVAGVEQPAVVVRIRHGEPAVPAANAFAGWSPGTEFFTATLDAVRAFHHARQLSEPGQRTLADLDGGWDVGLGNVVLVAGVPSCVVHGELEMTEPAIFRCAVCGAAASYPPG